MAIKILSLNALPSSAKNLIKYQQDSIVSKEIVQSDSCTITLFAFDKNQNLSSHSTPFNAIVQIIDNEAKIQIEKSLF